MYIIFVYLCVVCNRVLMPVDLNKYSYLIRLINNRLDQREITQK